jgi:TIR domain
MKVFISWSGSKSQAVALALRGWLRGVINSLEPFVSATDIDAGTRWQSEIASQLDVSNFGIVCVTKENQAAPWLNFEAGALAKRSISADLSP